MSREARTAAREVQRAADKAKQQARAARIRNFENESSSVTRHTERNKCKPQ